MSRYLLCATKTIFLALSTLFPHRLMYYSIQQVYIFISVRREPHVDGIVLGEWTCSIPAAVATMPFTFYQQLLTTIPSIFCSFFLVFAHFVVLENSSAIRQWWSLLGKSKFYYCCKVVQPHEVDNRTTEYARYAASGHHKLINLQPTPNLNTRQTQAIFRETNPLPQTTPKAAARQIRHNPISRRASRDFKTVLINVAINLSTKMIQYNKRASRIYLCSVVQSWHSSALQ